MRVFCAIAFSLAAACLTPRGGRAADLKAYRAARILEDGGSPVAPGVLLVRGRRVEAVLRGDAEIPDGAEVVDLGPVTVLPGFVNPLSAIAEQSYRGAGSGRATRSAGSPVDQRKSVALSRVKPEHSVYRRLGRTGYTSIAILPEDRGALIAGRASVIKPRRGGEEEAKDLAIAERSYLFLGFRSGKVWHTAAAKVLKEAAEKVVKEREAKKKAAEEAKKKAAAKKKPPPAKTPGKAEKAPPPAAKASAKTPPKKETPPDPLVQVFKGEVTAFLRVRTPAAVDHLFRLLDSLPLPMSFVLVTGPQPPEVVEKLAAQRKRIRGVVLEPSMGRLWETSIFTNTARLFLERGFEVAFVPLRDSLEGHRSVLFHLAEMVRSGVRASEAIRGVTSVPAGFLGLQGKVGVLKKGADANFVAYDRDPLSGSARLLRVYLEGEEIFSDDPATGELKGEAVR